MIVNLTYNGVSNEDKGFYLKSFPSFAFSNENYNSTVINGRRGALITNLDSYDNLKITVDFLIFGNYMERIRVIKQWLNGTGWLSFSDDADINYDVVKITYGDEDRKYYDQGKFTVNFYCFPYEFHSSGLAPLTISAGYINNVYDEALPSYELTAGSGTLTINDTALTYSEINETFIVDVRKCIVYGKETRTVYTGKTSGDFKGLILKNGKNVVSSSSEVIITPYWGYSL